MKKEWNLLRLFVLLIVTIVVIAGLLIGFVVNNRVDYDEVTEMHISVTNGFSGFRDKYTLTCKNGIWIAAIRDNNSDGFREMVVDDAFAAEIKELLAANKVHKWDGFSKEYKIVYDASSVDFYMLFSDGTEIEAHGYAVSPKNFYQVFDEIRDRYKLLFGESN